MAHILGKNISDKKNIIYGLTSIYGIGLFTANSIITNIKLDAKMVVGDLSENDILKITNFIQENFLIENILRREVSANIKELIAIRNYRGIRHSLNLPVRGQRTSCNAKTQKKLAKTRFK